jgi:hypothetical protein
LGSIGHTTTRKPSAERGRRRSVSFSLDGPDAAQARLLHGKILHYLVGNLFFYQRQQKHA